MGASAAAGSLVDLWQQQLEFQERVYGSMVALRSDVTRQTAVAKDLCTYAIAEVMELLQQLDWKTHRRDVGQRVVVSNVLEEWVDLFKFWLSIGLVWGFTPTDLLAEFSRKSRVVAQRFSQEHELRLDSSRTVVVDVDGVLADYAATFLQSVWQMTGRKIDAATLGGDVFEWVATIIGAEAVAQVKQFFRESGKKQSMPLVPGAAEFLQAVRACSGQIVVLSSRPYGEYKRMFADTMLWLQGHGLPFDALWMADNKADYLLHRLPEVSVVLEDMPSHAARLAAFDYRVWLITQPYNAAWTPTPGVERIAGMHQAAKRVLEFGLPPSNRGQGGRVL